MKANALRTFVELGFGFVRRFDLKFERIWIRNFAYSFLPYYTSDPNSNPGFFHSTAPSGLITDAACLPTFFAASQQVHVYCKV